VGGASALLDRRHRVVLAALAAGLAVYYAVSTSLWNASLWWDVAFLALVLMPAVFGLVWAVLPLVRARGLLALAGALVVVAVVLTAAHNGAVADFAKLAAATSLAFALLVFVDDLALVVLVAAIIPFVDAWSVWRGPTHVIVTHRRSIFNTLSFAFPVPGEHASANLGLPDLFFFAFFLAACAHFRLRVGWTWAAMVAGLGATMAIAVWLDLGGLPALPAIALGFVLPNADLLWRRLWVERPRESPSEPK
jgi:hypothetical protein